MSEYKKQTVLSSFYLVINLLLSIVSMLYLSTRALTTAQLGLIQFLLTVASIFGLFSQMGMRSVNIRYFPYFKDKAKKHNGYLSFVLLVPIVGLSVVFVIVYFFKDIIIRAFDQPESRELIQNYYWCIYPLLIALTYYDILSSYVSALYKPAVNIFLRDVFTKSIGAVLLLLIFYSTIGFNTYVLLVVAMYFIQLFSIMLYLRWIDEWQLGSDLSAFNGTKLREIFSFAFYTLSSGAIFYIFENTDRLMVSMLSEGQLADGGIYGIMFFIGYVVFLPGKAIANMAVPLIAAAAKENNLSRIENLYKSTSINQMATGGLLFIGICINLNHIITITGPAYAKGIWVAVLIGLSQMIDLATGLNGSIIVMSPYYKTLVVFNVLLVLVTIATNYWLIPIYGLTGAAIATVLTLLIFNTAKTIYVWKKMHIQPFSINTFKMLLLMIAVLAVGLVLPPLGGFFVFDLLYRSIIVTILYIGGIYYFNITPELTDLGLKMLNRVKVALKL
ncbi:MAG: oligosaccharide flippase family protein [Chitinophagales bacterium]|nr:polysaccharide biosynthesis protein [Bacteroidota bacterium]MCB9042407.1 polysaccharide biosynthesis protein [Chitinophagales bacterium]